MGNKFRRVRKSTKIVSFSLLIIVLFLTSCVTSTNANTDIAVLSKPDNASISVPFNNTEFVFEGKVGTQYELIVKEELTGSIVVQKAVTAQSKTVRVILEKGALKPNTAYAWYVRVKGSDAKTSELYRFTTKQNTAPKISALEPNGKTNQPFGQAALSWNAVDADADDLKFVVKVTRLGDTEPTYETTVPTNSCVVKGLAQLTTYSWSVVAEDPWGAKSEELNAEFRTKENEPPSRIDLKFPKVGEMNAKFNNLFIEWEGSDNDLEELTYWVSLKTASTNSALLSGATQTTYTVSGLKPDTTYTLTITAVDSYNESTTTDFTFKTRPNTPPSAPTLLEPNNNENINFSKVSDIVFRWNASTDVDEDSIYYVFILTDPYGKEGTRGPIYDTQYVLSKNDFSNGKTYGWRVEAHDINGGVKSSEKRTFTTFLNRPPYEPTNPNPANGAPGLPNRIPRFTWTATDPDGDPLTYDIYIGNSPTTLTLEATGLTSTQYVTPRLFDFSKTYYWKVVVHDDHNNTTEGPVWSFTITDKNYPPTAPELVSPSNKQTRVAFNGATLIWKASTDRETPQAGLTYYLYVGKADNMTLVATVTGETGSQISRTVANLTPSTVYYWRVEVKDDFGNYAYSTTWEFTTKENTAPYTPSNPNPADGAKLSSGKIILSWQCSDPDGDQLSYELYISNSSNFSGVSPILRNQPNYEWTPPSTGTYYWYVVAKDSYGGKADGPTWTFDIQ